MTPPLALAAASAAVRSKTGRRAGIALVLAPLVLVIVLVGGLLVMMGGLALAVSTDCGQSTGDTATGDSSGDGPGAGGSASASSMDAEQRRNAAVITQVAARLQLPMAQRQLAARIGVAVALRESVLRNISYGDRDSLGLFQQRGRWGSTSERTDPTTAALMFYTGGRGGQPGLLDISGWQAMTLTQAAQAVQRSAFPNAYARWADPATTLVAQAWPRDASTGTGLDAGLDAGLQGGLGSGMGGTCGGSEDLGADVSLPQGFSVPEGTPQNVQVAIAWALHQLGTPYTYGGTCTDPHGADPGRRCDCSSLVQQAYAKAGIALPRTTIGQRTAGRSVLTGQVQPGDLIFTAGSESTGPGDPRHVGMAIGSGLLVQAPQTGDVVKISRISGDWATPMAVRRVT
jgi:cell wall-associated NlpC family hydrolase